MATVKAWVRTTDSAWHAVTRGEPDAQATAACRARGPWAHVAVIAGDAIPPGDVCDECRKAAAA